MIPAPASTRIWLAAVSPICAKARQHQCGAAIKGIAIGRKSWLVASSERGAERPAAIATLISTAKLNDIDPQAWLADALARIADTQQGRLHELLPWKWTGNRKAKAA